MDSVRIIVADQQRMVCEALCSLLKSHDGIEVVGVAFSLEEVMEEVQEQAPDVLIISAIMGADDTRAISEFRKHDSALKVLVLSESGTRENILDAFSTGGDGLVSKRASASDLCDAIQAVVRYGYFISPPMARMMVNDYQNGFAASDCGSLLSLGQRQILRLIAERAKTPQIAEALGMTTKDVTRHRYSIMRKLGLRTPASLIKYATIEHRSKETNDQIVSAGAFT